MSVASKSCRSCLRGPLLEQFSCNGCPPQESPDSYDLCFDCCSNLAREAHTAHRGTDHDFELRRLGRYCNHCTETISSNFLMCTACRQDQDCFDLCYTCAFSADAIPLHQSITSPEHQFRPIQWRHYIPFQVPSTFKTVENWWCNVCSRPLNRSFFHCIGCGTGPNGYDLCVNCADNGGMYRHGVSPQHIFLYVIPLHQYVPPPTLAAPPSSAAPTFTFS